MSSSGGYHNLNVYVPNNKGSKYTKQNLIELQRKIGNPQLTKDFNKAVNN